MLLYSHIHMWAQTNMLFLAKNYNISTRNGRSIHILWNQKVYLWVKICLASYLLFVYLLLLKKDHNKHSKTSAYSLIFARGSIYIYIYIYILILVWWLLRQETRNYQVPLTLFLRYAKLYIYIFSQEMLLTVPNIRIKRTRHAVHCWRSNEELISDVLLWTPTHWCARVGQPARTYLQQLCTDIGSCLEDLPEVMYDRH